jgi:hypothetical protein
MKSIELSSPMAMSAGERAAEIATILARCILRQHAEHPDRERRVDLGCLPNQRLHTTPYPLEKNV